jgi:adenine-specific DNA-methyltransferase
VSEANIDLSILDGLSHLELIALVEEVIGSTVTVSFSGKANATRIARRVRPRVVRRIKSLCAGDAEAQAANLLIEGDNLQAMTTLYRDRGQVDLILTDPPYNTGRDFRYNDKWDLDPNDPGIGDLVNADDGARHTKWMRFMWPRLQMMRSMLRPGGVLAICIDHRELFRLGQMLDELFGEQNRISIINWQRAYTPRNDSKHVSISTEYVLVYSRDADKGKTALLPRAVGHAEGEVMPDGDLRPWNDAPATGSNAKNHKGMVYAMQSPFTGELIYPPAGSAWRYEQGQNLGWLKQWGVKYKAVEIDDAAKRADLIGIAEKDVPEVKALVLDESKKSARTKARRLYEQGPWPPLFFLSKGEGRPRLKKYRDQLKPGLVATNYWANDDYAMPEVLGSVSWPHGESGHSQAAAAELTAIVGEGHDFATVKPMKLFQKIIQLWCPPTGIVVDPFAGSGTTGHAVLALNHDTSASRRFILVEQGRPERGDPYASSLTADRLKRVVTGDWATGPQTPLGGGFCFQRLDKRVDAQALLDMERDEMVDTVIASHFDANRKRGSNLIRVNGREWHHLVAKNSDDEGFFLIWDGPDKNTDFSASVYDACAIEAEEAGLKPYYHVYARLYLYQTENVRFYQIPDRILADFGLDMSSEPFAEPS